MSAKRKPTESKHRKDRHEAEKYLWHLRPECREHFDHDHWWKKSGTNVPMEAVLWEIFRRHPETQRYHNEICDGKIALASLFPTSPPPQIAAWCCDSWPKLKKTPRRLWHEYLLEVIPPQRGFHPGAVIVLNNYRKELLSPWDSGKGDPAKFRDYIGRLSMTPTYQSRMTADVIEHDDKGRILFAIDPLSTGAGKRVEQVVKEWRKEKSAVKRGNSRLGQWGDVISSFEKQELKCEKRNDQLFARYRRIIGGLKLSR